MPTQEQWEAQRVKVKLLEKFSDNMKTVLLAVGVAIALAILGLYYGLVASFSANTLREIKTIFGAVLVGFSTSAAATGMFNSLYAGRVNVDILTNPPRHEDYQEGNELSTKLDAFKGEVKHYFQIAAVLLFLDALVGVIDIFAG